jgi:hypothetical protein
MPEIVTDAHLTTLRALAKSITNPRARPKDVEQMRRRNFEVVSLDGHQRFAVYTRLNLLMASDYSAGIRWIRPSGDEVPLARYNGPSHEHTNRIERDRMSFQTHVHLATERYQQAGYKTDGFARAINDYQDIDSALVVLCREWNIEGLPGVRERPATPPPAQQSDLFKC